jgi:hypothetical protein
LKSIDKLRERKNAEKTKEREEKEKIKEEKFKGKKKRNTSDAFDDIHAMEMKDMAERRDQKNALRLKQLELEKQKQEFAKEKHLAKVRKMELEAKRMEMESQKTQQMFQMMMHMVQSVQSHGTGSSTGAPSLGLDNFARPSSGFFHANAHSDSHNMSLDSDWGLMIDNAGGAGASQMNNFGGNFNFNGSLGSGQ